MDEDVKIHLIGICGTAMATLAAMLKRKGLDVQRLRSGRLPADERLPRRRRHPDARAATSAEHITARSRPRRRRQRDLARQPRARGGARSEDPLLLAAGGDPRALPLGRAVDRHRRHARQDHDDVADRLAADRTAGVDPSVLVGGIARNFGEHGSSYRIGQRARFRHRRRRVRQRVLRQDREVPEVPARHRRRQQRRVRSRRHLRRPRRGDAGVPPPRQSRAAPRPAAPRRRQPGARWRWPGRAVSRVADLRHRRRAPTGRRTTSSRPGASTRFQRPPRRLAVRRASRCRSSARTTCATRWRRSPSPPKSASAPSASPTACARSPASSGGSKSSASPTASRSTTTSRTIRRRSPRRWRACARRTRRADLGGVRAALRLVVPARLPGRLRPRVRRRRRGADRAGVPLDAARGRAAVGSAARARSATAAASRRARPARSTTSSRRSSASIAPGDLVVLMSNGGFGGIHQKLLRALA